MHFEPQALTVTGVVAGKKSWKWFSIAIPCPHRRTLRQEITWSACPGPVLPTGSGVIRVPGQRRGCKATATMAGWRRRKVRRQVPSDHAPHFPGDQRRQRQHDHPEREQPVVHYVVVGPQPLPGSPGQAVVFPFEMKSDPSLLTLIERRATTSDYR